MKRIIILIAAIALFLSACAGQTSSPTNAGKETTAQTVSSSDKPAEPIKISIGWARGANLVYPPGESMENNAWSRAYRDKLGFDIEYKIVAVTDQYQQRVALSIASKDMPDVWISDKKNFYLALEADLCLDLTDMFEKELTDLSKKYVGEYDLPFKAARINGRLMAFPQLNEDPTTNAPLTFIRRDWLEKLNLEVPKTQQQMIDTLIAFAQNDPDGNNQKDTIGMAVTKSLWGGYYGLLGFFNSYHAYPNIWYEENGKLVYGTVQADPMKAALSDLARLYQAGAIDREFVVKDSDKIVEDIVSQKIGAMYSVWHCPGAAPAKAFMADPEKVKDRWWCIDPVSVDGKPVMLQSSSSAPNNFMIANKNTKHPKAIFGFINVWFELMFSPDLTEEQYKTYAVSEDYLPQNYAFTVGLWPYVNPRIDNILGVNAGTINPNTLTGESAVIWKNITAFRNNDFYAAAFDHYWNYSFEEHSSMRVRWDVFKREGIVSNLHYGPSPQTMIEKMSTLDKMRDEIIVQIITGEKPAAEFDTFVQNWYKLGGTDIVNEMNEWYKTAK